MGRFTNSNFKNCDAKVGHFVPVSQTEMAKTSFSQCCTTPDALCDDEESGSWWHAALDQILDPFLASLGKDATVSFAQANCCWNIPFVTCAWVCVCLLNAPCFERKDAT